MKSIKTLGIIAVLAAAAGGVYVSLHRPPGTVPGFRGDPRDRQGRTSPSLEPVSRPSLIRRGSSKHRAVQSPLRCQSPAEVLR